MKARKKIYIYIAILQINGRSMFSGRNESKKAKAVEGKLEYKLVDL